MHLVGLKYFGLGATINFALDFGLVRTLVHEDPIILPFSSANPTPVYGDFVDPVALPFEAVVCIFGAGTRAATSIDPDAPSLVVKEPAAVICANLKPDPAIEAEAPGIEDVACTFVSFLFLFTGSFFLRFGGSMFLVDIGFVGAEGRELELAPRVEVDGATGKLGVEAADVEAEAKVVAAIFTMFYREMFGGKLELGLVLCTSS